MRKFLLLFAVLSFVSFSHANPYTNGFYDVPEIIRKTNDDLCKNYRDTNMCFNKMAIWASFHHVAKNRDRYDRVVDDLMKKNPRKTRQELETQIMGTLSNAWKSTGQFPNISK